VYKRQLLASGVGPEKTVVAAMDLYGATLALLNRHLTSLGAMVYPADVADLENMEQVIEQIKPVAVIVETISNPMLKVADLKNLALLAHRNEALLLVDNTFASPWLMNPLLVGADMVIHSATKYIAGHGDVMAGVVVTGREKRADLYELTKLTGGVLGPFEAWLAIRGLKTLSLRMREQCASALRIAHWLESQPRVTRVHYPGLPSHPQHKLADELFQGKGFGGVLSFELDGADRKAAFRFMECLQLCLPATSLGDIYTLILHPATTSHRSLDESQRKAAGICEGLLRLSVGIEDTQDIIGDLEQALDNYRS